MTEDEAKTTVCPQTLHVWEGTGKVMHNVGAHCLGSDCMAFRTMPSMERDGKTVAKYERAYCGLAGKP